MRPGAPALRIQYETLRSVLYRNGTALQLMADLEADLGHLLPSEGTLLPPVRRLLDEVLLMTEELNLLSGDRYRALYGAIEKIRGRIYAALRSAPRDGARPLSVTLQDEACCAQGVVGGKAAGLAALRQVLPAMVPAGFVLTTEAYRLFVRENGLAERIRTLLTDLDVMTRHPRFEERTEAIRNLILDSPVPQAIRRELVEREQALGGEPVQLWAVRSSALSEDDRFSFAGQFETRLNVPADELPEAYRAVLASRFSSRAVLYRLHCGLRDVDTPMAVLFVPMIDPTAAGVVYTCDPQDPRSGEMVLAAVPGLADRMVRGEQAGTVLRVPRFPHDRAETETPSADSIADRGQVASAPIGPDAAARIGRAAAEAASALGHELDVEWALDKANRLWLLQARRLRVSAPAAIRADRRGGEPPLLESGYTLFPGRAEGPVERLQPGSGLELRRNAPILVIEQGTPEYAPLLPRIAALLIERGSAVGHLATLAREFRLPSLYGVGQGATLLRPDEVISVDATTRRIYRGSRWPAVRERVLSRIAAALERAPSGPLQDLVLALNLTDPFAASFKPGRCRSLHDVVRFVHEKSVLSLFRFGDRQKRAWRGSVKRLDCDVPLRLKLVDLDGSTPSGKRSAEPHEVESVPFRALWRGISDPRISWQRRSMQHLDLDILPPNFVEQVFGGVVGPRRPRDTNYAVVGADYLNLNARFVFHYAMLDAFVGPGKETNHVQFRFRGGGGSRIRRDLRARFIETVLRHFHFGVDRRGDLVTAWLRNYPRSDSESALEMLGRLMACSRQLDMYASNQAMMDRLVESFLREEYSAFA